MEVKDLKNATILVVDDNPINLNVLSDSLTDYGFTILLKKDGEKALALVKRIIPDLILLDIVMPGIDGFETCRQLKENDKTKDIPVIFMTALSDTFAKLRGFELGAVDYITKPFHQEEVLARVKAHLTIQKLKKDLQIKNRKLQNALERERKLMEDLRLNLSLSLPHELRTPLNGILGFSSFLADPAKLPKQEKIIEYGKSIYESGLRLHRLIENALLYANLKLLKYAPTERRAWQSESSLNAQDFITSVARQRSEEAHRQDDMILELADVSIMISPKNLEKILSEILDNAFKFSEKGSPVRIKTSVNGNLCILSINDQGRGMTKEQIANIGAYMQFDRERHEQQGSGLGLIISYLLAQLEGGMLSIDSEPGNGATVSVVLSHDPNSKNTSEKTSAYWFDSDIYDISEKLVSEPEIVGFTPVITSILGKSFEREKYKIMVIEDKKGNRSVLVNLLLPIGFEMIEVSDGYDGLSKVLECQPDLIFIDVFMLEAGIEAISRLKQSPASDNVTVIAVSPGTVNAVQQESITSLCDDVISAPVQLQEIFNKLEFHLGLEWIYKNDKEKTAFAVPSEAELIKLHTLVMDGEIEKFSEQLDNIEQMGDQYAPFVKKLRQFAGNFQMKLIREFLDKYMQTSG